MRMIVGKLAPMTLGAVIVGGALAMPEVWAQPEKQPQAQPGRRAGGPGGPGEGGPGGRVASVEGSMKAMNRGLRELRHNLADASKKDQNLASVWGIERACVAAKAGKPDNLEGDQVKMLDTFRREQIKLMTILLDLETAILDGKTDAAQALLKKVVDLRDESHKTFKVKDEDDEGGAGR